ASGGPPRERPFAAPRRHPRAGGDPVTLARGIRKLAASAAPTRALVLDRHPRAGGDPETLARVWRKARGFRRSYKRLLPMPGVGSADRRPGSRSTRLLP